MQPFRLCAFSNITYFPPAPDPRLPASIYSVADNGKIIRTDVTNEEYIDVMLNRDNFRIVNP